MKQIDMTLNNHNSHTNHTTSSGDDLGSTDEVKVFKDEGDREDEKISSENLLEEKSSLIDLTESEFISYQEKNGKSNRSDHSSLVFGKVEPPPNFASMGYFVSPYATYAAAANSGTKIGLPPFFHNSDAITSPPPAHCGIPPYQFDPTKTIGLPRPPLYPFTASQYPYLMLSPEMSQVAAASAWHHATAGPTMYPTAASTFRTPAGYPSTLPIPTNDFSLRFSPNLLSHTPPHHVMNTAAAAAAVAAAAVSQHSAIVTPGPKQDIKNHHQDINHHQFNRFNSGGNVSNKIAIDNHHQLHNLQQHHQNSLLLQHQQQQQQQQQHHHQQQQQQHNQQQQNQKSSSQNGAHVNNNHQVSPNDSQDNSDKGKIHIKKPLNAFMLYMKEMRSKVVAECTLKESAAINQILGQRWHALGREEQAKYYEMARRERQLHMQMYPDWSSRTNITRGKKRKRKQDITNGNNSMKKCRARFGLDQQNQWCKPCRRKKKCIRYMETDNENNNNNNSNNNNNINKNDDNHNINLNHHQDEDNLGSCGSTDEAKTPEDDTESFNQSVSSPGGFSGLSSLQSPSMSVASPLNFLASPATPSNLLHGNSNNLLLEQHLIKSQHPNQINSTTSLTTTSNSSNNMNEDDKSSLMNINAATKSSLSSITSHLSSINVQSPRPSSNENSISNNNNNNQPQQTQPSLSSASSTSSSKSASSNSFTDLYFDKIMPNATRSPVGANPRDINNPLSINQLTKRDFPTSNSNNNNNSNSISTNINSNNSNNNNNNNSNNLSLYSTSTTIGTNSLSMTTTATSNNINNSSVQSPQNSTFTSTTTSNTTLQQTSNHISNTLDLLKESQHSPLTSSPMSSSSSSTTPTSASSLLQLPHHQSSLLNSINSSIKQPLPPPPPPSAVSLSNFLADISQHNLHNFHHNHQHQQQQQQFQLQQHQQQQQHVANSFIQHLQQQQLQLHLQQQQQQHTSLLLSHEQQPRLQPK